MFHPIDLNGNRALIAKEGCYVTGDTNHLVSTGVIIEGEGLLCLSRGVIHDLALAAGFDPVPRDLHDRLRAEKEARTRAEDRVLYLEGLLTDVLRAVEERRTEVPDQDQATTKNQARTRAKRSA